MACQPHDQGGRGAELGLMPPHYEEVLTEEDAGGAGGAAVGAHLPYFHVLKYKLVN